MGRSVAQERFLGTRPSGFYQEVNSSMMEDMWRTLAAQAHPDILSRAQVPSMDEVFGLLSKCSWSDFWQAFPYELREHGSYLDELDALGLLLASPMSKKRFERYFEQHARQPPSAATSSITGNRSTRSSVQDQQQQQQQALPVRRRALLQQQRPPAAAAATAPAGGPVVYVGPAVPPGQFRAAAAAPTGYDARGMVPAAVALGQNHPHLGFMNAMMSAFGLRLADPSHYRAAAAAAAAGHANGLAAAAGGSAAGAGAAGPRGAAAAAAEAPRLSGRRRSRTWEACDVDLQQQQQQQVPGPGSSTSAAGAGSSAAAEAAAAPAAAGASTSAAAAAVDNSHMWRAVHECLTADDEALLLVVSRLVPFSITGSLRPEAETRAQLQQIADSRPVPPKAVGAIADRISETSDSQLVRVTARSGYSRRAAAAAAALAAPCRMPFYIPLAGCISEDDVESAIMRGIFGADTQQQQQQQGQQQQQHEVQGNDGAAAAAADGTAAGGVERGHDAAIQQQQQQQQQRQQQQQDQQLREEREAAVARIARLVAGTEDAALRHAFGVVEQLERQQQQEQERQQQLERQQQQQQARGALEAGRMMAALMFGGPGARVLHIGRPFEVGDMEDEQAGMTSNDDDDDEPPGLFPDQMLDEMEFDGDEDDAADAADGGDGGDGNGGSRAGPFTEQLSAHLTLLATCSKQPLLLLFDEADTAMLPGGGQQFRRLLLRLLCRLPQAVVLLTSSIEAEGLFADSLLCSQGPSAHYKVADGTLSIASYRIPRPLYYHCMHCL